MKILIDEMNPSAIRLKGDKTNFKEHPNRLYFAVCLIEDQHFDALGKNFTNMIKTKLLFPKNDPQPLDYFNKLNYISDYQEGLDAHNNSNFSCYCEKKPGKTNKNKSDICRINYFDKKNEKNQSAFVNSELKQKSFLQFLSENKIKSCIFVIDCENMKKISETNDKETTGESEFDGENIKQTLANRTLKELNGKNKWKGSIFNDLGNQTGIIGNILSNLFYRMEKLKKAQVIDIYLDYWSMFNEQDCGLSTYVKSSLKKYLFCYRDIEENIPKSSLEKLKQINGLKDIFKLMPKKFNGEDNASVHFVHQRTDPMILLPDLILKSYKRLFLNSTNEEENLKLFYDLINIHKKSELPYKLEIFNMFCDVNKIKQNNNELQNNYCTGENSLQENTKNKKPLIWNESRENDHRLCGGHGMNQNNQFSIFKLVKKELDKKLKEIQ